MYRKHSTFNILRYKRRLSFLILLSVFLIFGCGYRFGSGGENIDKKIQNIFVDNFTNRTSEANLENYFRKAFINQILKGNRFKLADRRDSCDAVLKGSIKTFTTSPLAYNSNNITIEERISVTIEIIFEGQATKKIIWADQNFSGTEDYNIDNANLMAILNTRKNALTKLSNDTAERTFAMIISDF